MRWPWTSRALLESSERRATESESRACAAEQRLDTYMAEANQRVADAQAERDAARAEGKLLLDRIVQLSGQPPIFHPVPTSPTPTASTIPAPETRDSFSDVHKLARAAIQKGEMGLLSRSN